jgi:AbiV family abortive infection protein
MSKENRKVSGINPELFVNVTALSLRNAELWIDDAKALMKKSSFGHSIATLHLAREEISKALICWQAAEGMFPIKDNKGLRQIFSNHIVKNQIAIGICNLIWMRTYDPKMQGKGTEPTSDMIDMADTFLNEGAHGLEMMRQRATYVDIDRSQGMLTSPDEMKEDEALRTLKAVETFLRNVKNAIKGMEDSKKDELRKVYGAFPPEVWATGRINLSQLMKAQRKLKSADSKKKNLISQ